MMKQNITLFVQVRPPTKAGPAHLELRTAVPHLVFIDDLLDVVRKRERVWDANAKVWRIPDRPPVRNWIANVARLYFEAAFLIDGAVMTNLLTGNRLKQLTIFD